MKSFCRQLSELPRFAAATGIAFSTETGILEFSRSFSRRNVPAASARSPYARWNGSSTVVPSARIASRPRTPNSSSSAQGSALTSERRITPLLLPLPPLPPPLPLPLPPPLPSRLSVGWFSDPSLEVKFRDASRGKPAAPPVGIATLRRRQPLFLGRQGAREELNPAAAGDEVGGRLRPPGAGRVGGQIAGVALAPRFQERHHQLPRRVHLVAAHERRGVAADHVEQQRLGRFRLVGVVGRAVEEAE